MNEDGKSTPFIAPDAAVAERGWNDYGSGRRIQVNEKLGSEKRIIQFTGNEVMAVIKDYFSKHYGLILQDEQINLDLTEGRSADAGGPGCRAKINGLRVEV